MSRSLQLLLLWAAACAAQAQNRLTVHLERVVEADYLGVNAVYHGFAFMPEQESRGMNDEDRAREFGRVAAMRLNVARTWYRPDWACGDSLANPPDWDSSRMRAFYQWLGEMQERHVDVALQAGWWFSRDTYLGTPPPDAARDLDRYPRWVSESLHQIVEVRGFRNVRYLVLFTEPTSYQSGDLPPGETQWSYYAKMVRAIDARLRSDGRRGLVKLIGPNNTGGGKHLKEAAAELNDVIDIYSGHDYNKAGYDQWLAMCRQMMEAVAATGKPLWLDELGKQDEVYRLTGDYGNYLAQIVAASINAGFQTSMQWLLFDQLYVAPIDKGDGKDGFHMGVHRWGACKWPHDSVDDPAACYPQWGAVRLMSRYLGGRNGTKSLITQSAGPLRVAATAPQGHELSVLVVNTTGSAHRFSLEIRGAAGARTLYRHLYDPGARFSSRTAASFRGRIRDRIPARGVAVYSTVP